MCLAIAMYLVTGSLSLAWQLLVALGAFLLGLLGKAIIFVCASIYTVARPSAANDAAQNAASKSQPGNAGETSVEGQPEFETMYPELYDFGDDFDTMARVSLETVTSVSAANTSADEASSPARRTRRRLQATADEASLSSSCSSAAAARHRRPPRRRRQTTAAAAAAGVSDDAEKTAQQPKSSSRRFSK